MTIRWKAREKYAGAVFYPLIFGGFGLLDFDMTGFLVMSVLEVLALLLCLVGIGFLLLPLVHLASICWAVAVVPRNRRQPDAARAAT